jgi:excisionase family DNA binding protein
VEEAVTPRDALTVKEASLLLVLDEARVTRMAEAREIPAVEVDGQWLFSRKSLQKWRELRTRRDGQPA